jgi:hypothetical protein
VADKKEVISNFQMLSFKGMSNKWIWFIFRGILKVETGQRLVY